MDVLLDQRDGDPLVADVGQHVEQKIDDGRRELPGSSRRPSGASARPRPPARWRTSAAPRRTGCPRAVRADGDDLARKDLERDVAQHGHVPITRARIGHSQQSIAHAWAVFAFVRCSASAARVALIAMTLSLANGPSSRLTLSCETSCTYWRTARLFSD